MSKIKTIYCIHHSHFDLGYTHPQELILEHQEEYISQGIKLCDKYKQEDNPFRWTIEATLPLLNWLDDATVEEQQQLKELIKKGLISVAALPMHTTPLNDGYQLKKLLEYKKRIEQQLDIKITTAINHDINGQPWSFGDILLDADVNFYLTGENIHFGGIPFPRPKAFHWETPSSRKIVSFLGEHYSLFSQFLKTDQRDIEVMKKGIITYTAHLEEKGYDKDYAVLTATNPPLLDNNSPDCALFDLVRAFNEQIPDYKIKFITPEILYSIVSQDSVTETVKGDWTDFWNFGAGSTPYEVKYNKIANQNIKKAALFEAFATESNKQYQRVKESALLNSLLYNEHTWGAANSVTEPDSFQAVAGKVKKASYCFDAVAQSAFLLNKSIDSYQQVMDQNETIHYLTVTNTSSFPQKVETQIPKAILENRPFLSSFKSNLYLHGETAADELCYGPKIDLAPYQSMMIPVEKFHIRQLEKKVICGEKSYETESFVLKIDEKGKINQLYSKAMKMDIIASDDYGFFDLVVETIDGTKNNEERATFFPRDIELANYSISVWNHEWQAIREKYIGEVETATYEWNGHLVIETTYKCGHSSIAWLKRKITLNDEDGTINVSIRVKRNPTTLPTAHYLIIPTSLNQQWTAVFESADTLCKLDEEQIGAVSKDWVTLGSSMAFYDENQGMYFANSDAPLVQMNGFSFGRESKEVSRTEKPMFLSWIYNNYWDTNFAASDDSEIEHNYLIKPFRTYSEEEQVALGVQMNHPVEYSWAVKSESFQLPIELECQNTQILSIEKIDKHTIQLFVKNYKKESGQVKLTNTADKIMSLRETDLAGREKRQFSIDETIILPVVANCFGYFQLIMR
ncbi:hypothetical protein [Candidatus Enterococcus clewellii]|uniref:Glycoside hydrolase family 38 N-terminal domain-containing protein n=1 Tax=Candidatus Enterococcus clewellii TaxID=1834193 RepID=A0A242KE28_9ENTE|nr:hypothetical protein [Enterococcus sp. 9E7_DIV0242]OTP19423.1 hypothetical protein A5888_001240 [Enterococcus sp. 9E7_DIV0242]